MTDEHRRASLMLAAIEADDDPGSRALANTIRRTSLERLLRRAQSENWPADLRLRLIRKLEPLPDLGGEVN